MVLLFPQSHIFELEKWEVCGCPECLVKLGLKRAWVWDPEKRRNVSLLLPLQPVLPGCMVNAPCSEMLNSENESQS